MKSKTESSAHTILNSIFSVILIAQAIILLKCPETLRQNYASRFLMNKAFADEWLFGIGSGILSGIASKSHLVAIFFGIVLLNIASGILCKKVIAYKIFCVFLLIKFLLVNNPLVSKDSVIYKRDLHQLTLDLIIVFMTIALKPEEADYCKCGHTHTKVNNSEAPTEDEKKKNN